VARMNSYEVHGLRVSSSAVREALFEGRMAGRQPPDGPPLPHLGSCGAWPQIGSQPGLQNLNQRFAHWKPAASGIFAVLVHGLAETPLMGVANLGIRPSLDPKDVNGGRVLLETHCLDWPAHLGAEGAYGKIVRVELLHKLHDELKYDSLIALTAGIRQDCEHARAYFASLQHHDH